MLAMAAGALRVLAATLLEGDQLGAAGLLDELRRDLRAGNQRRAELDALVLADQQHFGEFPRATGVAGQPLDLLNVVLGNTAPQTAAAA